MGVKRIALRGYKEKSFAIGWRYELGMYFGKRKTAKVRFGLSGGIEPTFYQYKRTPSTTQQYPINAKVFTIEAAVIPMLSAKLSKKITFDFKIIPNILMADFGEPIKSDPAFPSGGNKATRDYNLPEINTVFSMVLRYNFKEKKK